MGVRVSWQYDISIHTPTKGVTTVTTDIYPTFFNFNPHSHEGSDGCSGQQFYFCEYFNPHSHEGSDDPG